MINMKKKLFVSIIACLPILRLIVLAALNRLGANPVEFVIHSLGTWALIMLLVTLSMTPLRYILKQPWPVQWRRMFGLWSFAYASLHVLAYAGLDQWFDWHAISHDIAKHPYILLGLGAYLAMLPLALTSTNSMMRRLGKHWKSLHRFVYAIGILAVSHYWFLVKKDVTMPAFFALTLVLLLCIRIVHKYGYFRSV
jgi:sulfoxide reductase heme-binding subunit YedZ